MNISKVISDIRELEKIISRLPSSIKNDVQGISQKDKRVITHKVNTIYKEMVMWSKFYNKVLEKLHKLEKES